MSEIHSVNDLAACVFDALIDNQRKGHYELSIARVPGHLFWSDGRNIWHIDLAEAKPDAYPIRCDLFNGPVRDLVIEWLTTPQTDRELSQAGSLYSIVHDDWALDWIECPLSPHKTEGPYLFGGEWIFQHRDEMDHHYLSVSEAIEHLTQCELDDGSTPFDREWEFIPF